ncbi:integral membrane protein [Anseongella ginsenosidimutans]|uniref:Integral membrane protein n=1 Tax=Anseongella ginsenosidimutans TaxID=496056 RepID=A0A4R3KT91_9SPHI|nr:DUF3817 domain-containing protein [Anseongella ginsenosidimutans]QEC53113.1 DUF3817 domain-containing protein [Anseongella ginsenosidimutans]TCS87731.1 integral membrane protein [Anseongella ginsenosidimutans]
MNTFLATALGRFRLIAIAEGISYLFLLFVAMPLKYFAGMPEVVKYGGWVHGLLFILFMFALLEVSVKRKWTIFKASRGFISSLIPFGTFVFDRELKKEAELTR